MKQGEDDNKFKELLDEEYTWPANYIFKFIVSAEKVSEVTRLFEPEADIRIKESSKGKYTSVTVNCVMPDAGTIIAIYQKASEIEGIISL